MQGEHNRLFALRRQTRERNQQLPNGNARANTTHTEDIYTSLGGGTSGAPPSTSARVNASVAGCQIGLEVSSRLKSSFNSRLAFNVRIADLLLLGLVLVLKPNVTRRREAPTGGFCWPN